MYVLDRYGLPTQVRWLQDYHPAVKESEPLAKKPPTGPLLKVDMTHMLHISSAADMFTYWYLYLPLHF